MSPQNTDPKDLDVTKGRVPVPEVEVPVNKPKVSTELDNPLNEPEATQTDESDVLEGYDDEELVHARKTDIYPDHTKKEDEEKN